MTVSNCGKEAACAIDGKAINRTPRKSKRTESRLRAGMQMQP
jgi:hypothetical protein